MHESSAMHVNLQTRRVEFPIESGTTASGYEARPAGSGSYPGVLVLHEWWGVNDHIPDIAVKYSFH